MLTYVNITQKNYITGNCSSYFLFAKKSLTNYLLYLCNVWWNVKYKKFASLTHGNNLHLFGLDAFIGGWGRTKVSFSQIFSYYFSFKINFHSIAIDFS